MSYKRISPQPVVEGGTGSQSLTGVCIGNGTAAITGNAITQYNTLVGGAANAISSIAPSATVGVPLVSGGAAANPTFGTAVVAGGGTGAVSFTAHGVLLGEGTSAIGVTAAATTGQVLTGVTGSDPVWASPAASSISITGDSGGALAGSAFTLTGGTTGLTFSGAGTTETLTGTLVVGNGGTGATTLTGVLTGNGTSAVTANTVTQHGVLLGGASNAVSSTSVGATGTVLIGTTGSDASFSATPNVTSITFGAGDALSTYTNAGTWTPTIVGGSTAGTTTYSTQTGQYIRIGNLVIVQCTLSITAATGTGTATVGGLPFTVRSGVNPGGTAVFSTAAGWTWPAGTTMLNFTAIDGTTTGIFQGNGSAGASGNLAMANAAFSVVINIAYFI